MKPSWHTHSPSWQSPCLLQKLNSEQSPSPYTTAQPSPASIPPGPAGGRRGGGGAPGSGGSRGGGAAGGGGG